MPLIENAAGLVKGESSEARLRGQCLELLEAVFEEIDVKRALHRELKLSGSRLRVRNKSFDLKAFEHVYVIGFGKASGLMALVVEEVLGDWISGGVVNTVEAVPTKKIEVNVAAHPLPDQRGVEGAKKIFDLAKSAGEKDLILCLVSGGGSALLPLPAEGVSLKDEQELTSRLLKAGANIRELNCVRKHLSRVKGGQLAKAAAPATLLCLLVSDVIGDALDVIASGPTAPDECTFASAVLVLKNHGLWDNCPATAKRHLVEGIRKKTGDTPKKKDKCFRSVHNLVILNNAVALNALKKRASELGIHCLVFSDKLAGEARNAGWKLASGLKLAARQHKFRPPALLAAGETTVKVKGKGRGGRNLELVLGGCEELSELENALLCSIGTDGIDGTSDAAGAIATTSTLARAHALGLDWKKFLDDNDSHAFFAKLGDLVMTGYTKTNVMDVQIALLG
ncbi:MAG TPA: glycerate kinase [Candidatus Diapherotrites archaeon]|uniref:Glycerate kinase n=1 Tax=Candidatus Iainarchaeum sp. TaxID=3101447 RepID=A0A7J4JHP3_9ARCH|nr:glycerate kinase [Candidatus Diapherotrites archaeon]